MTQELQAAASGCQSSEDQLAKARQLLESAQQMAGAAAAARASQVAELTCRVEAAEAALLAARQEAAAAAAAVASQRAELERVQGAAADLQRLVLRIFDAGHAFLWRARPPLWLVCGASCTTPCNVFEQGHPYRDFFH